jgi:hypothetical protein
MNAPADAYLLRHHSGDDNDHRSDVLYRYERYDRNQQRQDRRFTHLQPRADRRGSLESLPRHRQHLTSRNFPGPTLLLLLVFGNAKLAGAWTR